MAGLGTMLWEGVKSAAGALPGTLLNTGLQFLTAGQDRDFQREMVDKANEYNSPRNQARLMQQGGFSPAALFGQNGSSIAQMHAPSVGSHSFTPVVPDSLMNPFSSVAQALQSLSQADKNTAEIPLIAANIEKLFSDARLNDSYTALNQFTDKMNQIYGSALKSNELRKLIQEGNKLAAEAELAGIQGDTEKARKLLFDAQSAYYDSMKGLTDEQKLQAQMETQYHVARIRSEIDANRAQAQRHRAESSAALSVAELNHALAQTENNLRDGKIRALDLANDLSFISKQMAGRENVRDAATHEDKIHAIVEQCRAQGLINETTEQEIRRMMTDNDWNGVHHAMKAVSDGINSVVSVGNLRVAELNALTQQQRNTIQSKIADAINARSSRQHSTRSVFDENGNLRGYYQDYAY